MSRDQLCTTKLTMCSHAWCAARISTVLIFSLYISDDVLADVPANLAIDRTYSRLQSADEQVDYALEAGAGQTYLLTIDQQGLDFIVSVKDPRGRIRIFNSPLFRDEREIVLLENTDEGVYEVSILSDEYTAAKGAASITVTSLVRDPERTDAWRLMSQGAAANARIGQEAWAEAFTHYSTAADLWNESGQTRERSQAQYSAAFLAYWRLYDWELAIRLAADAAAGYSEIQETELNANANVLQALALIEQANEIEDADADGIPPDAKRIFDRALQLLSASRATHALRENAYDVGRIEDRTGVTYQYMGDHSAAREHYQQAVTLFHGMDEWSAEIGSLTNIGILDFDEGNLVSAIASLQEVFRMLPAHGLEATRAWVTDTLAATHSYLGNLDEALLYFQEALTVHREIDDRHGETDSLLGLGRTYFAIGDLDLAETYLQEALVQTHETSDARVRESALRYLGNIQYLRGDYSAAQSLHQSAMTAATSSRDRAKLQLALARDLRSLGRFDTAVRMADKALTLAEEADSDFLRANARLELGQIAVDAKDASTANRQLEVALEFYRSLGLPVQEAEATHALALATGAQGDFPGAAALGERSLQIIESLRGNIADPELRAFFSASWRKYYDTQIDLLMTSGKRTEAPAGIAIREALAVSERVRARMTLELLNEAAVELGDGLDVELAGKRRKLMSQLAELRYRQNRLIRASDRDSDTSRALAEIVGELAETEHALNLIETESQRARAATSALTDFSALGTSEIQSMLDDETTLLEYALGAKRSYVWVVRRDSVESVELAPMAEIEEASRQAFEQLRSFQASANSRKASAAALQRLAELVLTPVEEHLQGSQLVIAADGALHYVPFGVLPSQLQGGQRLLQTHDIVSVPSMSAIAAQRRQAAPRLGDSDLLVVADPVFTEDDPRFGSQNASTGDSPVTRGSSDQYASFLNNLDRLVYTGREARVIGALVPEPSRSLMTGFDASLSALLDKDLRGYRYIHFATHGLVDSRYPVLSALALSRFNQAGQPQDALLHLSDIYGLRLNADLVVLSACETALGREIRGEGLIGLTQGFLYAGARSLVVSLWQVPDRATSELMGIFYRFLIEGSLKPARALRQAQMKVASQRRWSDPYFWSAMVLVGDWQ